MTSYFSSITGGKLGSVCFSGNGKVYVNGRLINGNANHRATKLKLVLCDDDGNEITDTVEFKGRLGISIKADTVEQVKTMSADVTVVAGQVGEVTTMSGNIRVEGNITGNATSTSGDIKATSIHGRCSTVSGDVYGKK